MVTRSGKSQLAAAQRARNDEFYTLLDTINDEVGNYAEKFKGKVVYCNCDDPTVSKFFKYFTLNFETLGLKALIATCYRSSDPDLFSTHDCKTAWKIEYRGFRKGENTPNEADFKPEMLRGDGDFRSAECIHLLKQADIVVTNPPFSLFHEYINQLMEHKKEFLILGNMNAVSYKDVFPLIESGQIWLGVSPRGMNFETPSGDLQSVNAVWYTNLDHSKRHEELDLFCKYSPADYPPYDNFDAIEVSSYKMIPGDYEGVMGIPITALDKISLDQFDIIGVAKVPCGSHLRTKIYPKQIQVDRKKGVKKVDVTKLNDGPVICIDTPPQSSRQTYYEVNGKLYIQKYARILIRNKNPEKGDSNV